MDSQLRHDYKQINWERLLRKDLGDSGQLTELEPVFSRLKLLFDRLSTDTAVNSLAREAIEEISHEIRTFLNFTEKIKEFVNIREKSNLIIEAKSLEFQTITKLSKLDSYFSLIEDTGLREAQIRKIVDFSHNQLKKDIESVNVVIKNVDKKITSAPAFDITKAQVFLDSIPEAQKSMGEALTLAENLNAHSQIFNEAVSKASEFVAKNDEAIASVAKVNATNAAKKAQEHSTFKPKLIPIPLIKNIPYIRRILQIPSLGGSYLWLLASFLFGVIVFLAVAFFAFSADGDVTIGNAVLHISAIVAPSYFALFCAQQFLNQKRLYEAYMFKDLALQTMTNLRQFFSDDSDYEVKKEVTLRGIQVLFSEPALKEDLKYDKNLLTGILDVLKTLRKD